LPKGSKVFPYAFKRYVNVVLVRMMLDKFKDSTFTCEGNGELVMINTSGVQFSFHKINIRDRTKNLMDEEIKKYKKGDKSVYLPEEWGGVRLQPIASQVYNYAKNLQNLTDKKFDRETTEKEI
jgi:hypothetical protein